MEVSPWRVRGRNTEITIFFGGGGSNVVLSGDTRKQCQDLCVSLLK
jgi:hypothetical protein